MTLLGIERPCTSPAPRNPPHHDMTAEDTRASVWRFPQSGTIGHGALIPLLHQWLLRFGCIVPCFNVLYRKLRSRSNMGAMSPLQHSTPNPHSLNSSFAEVSIVLPYLSRITLIIPNCSVCRVRAAWTTWFLWDIQHTTPVPCSPRQRLQPQST